MSDHQELRIQPQTQPLLPRRQRNRQTLVCRNCRVRKVKCDRNVPCGPCQKTRAQCTYSLNKAPSPSPTPVAAQPRTLGGHKTLAFGTTTPQPNNSITFIESLSTSSTPAKLVGAHQSFSNGPSQSQPRGASASPPPQSVQNPLLFEPETATFSESTFRTEIHRTLDGTFSKTRLFGRSHWMHSLGRFNSVVTLMQNPLFNSKMFPNENNKDEIMTLIKRCKSLSKSNKLDLHQEWLSTTDISTLIPSKYIADKLISSYFRTGESIHRILHIPSFMREYERYWLYPMSKDTTFLLTMLLAMSNGAIFYQGPDAINIISQAKKWVFAGQHWLSHAPSEKSRLTISGIQIHCLVILARQAHGMVGDLAWISVGSLLRTARMMGLDRDPKFIPNMKPLHAELRRRLWFTIIELNLHLSLDMGKRPEMSMDDWDTTAPANVNDADIESDSNVEKSSDKEFTQSTLQLLLSESFQLRLEACQMMNKIQPEVPYDAVLALASQLMKATKRANDIPNLSQLHRNLYDIQIRRNIFLLHAIYASKAVADPRYYYSHKVCLDTARTMATYPHRDTDDTITIDGMSDFEMVKLRSQDYFKCVMIHGCVTILLELFQNIENDSNEPLTSRQQRRQDREPWKQVLRDALKLTESRIEFAPNNVKGHLFLSAVYGQMEALENGTDTNFGAVQAAVESARVCLERMDISSSQLSMSRNPERMVATNEITNHIPTPPESNLFGDFDLGDFVIDGFADEVDPWAFTWG